MMILALEFSSAHRSVALLRRQEGTAPAEVLGSISDHGARAAKPLPLIQAVLGQAGATPDAVQAVVVGLGPGSYTGIRSAIALAQGWQLGRGVKTCGVSSVECLASQAQANAWHGPVSFVLDAQRQEFYLATYEITLESRTVLEPLRLVNLEQVRSVAGRPGMILAGPEVTKWFPGGRVLMPEATFIGQLARPLTDSVPGEKLEPIYLRETTFVKAPLPRIIPSRS